MVFATIGYAPGFQFYMIVAYLSAETTQNYTAEL
jgi:hypothetical protein